MTRLQQWLVTRVDEGLAWQGWTQTRLAAEAGISQKHLSEMLRGRAEGSLTVWDRLLALLEIRFTD